ncbi:MAG: GDSL-type esterase/lipase family protein [Rickettsiales bacterium]
MTVRLFRRSFFTFRSLAAATAIVVGVWAHACFAQEDGTKPTYKVALLGDGFFSNPGLDDSQSFARLLKETMAAQGVSVEILDFSAEKNTTSSGVDLLKNVLEAKPDATIVHLGFQDLKSKIDPVDVFNNLRTILYNLERHNVPTLFFGVDAPTNLYEVFDYNVQLADRYKASFAANFVKLASLHRVTFRPSLLGQYRLQSYYLMPDGVHPNQRGVREAANGIQENLRLLLKYKDDPAMLHNMAENAPQALVIYGEQLMSAYKGHEEASFPYLLEQQLKYVRKKRNVEITNFSEPNRRLKFSGDRAAQIMALHPAIVLLQLGVRDVTSTESVTAVNDIAAQIAGYMKTFQANDVSQILLGVKNPNFAPGVKSQIPKFAVLYEYLGKKFNVPTVPNVVEDVKGYMAGDPRVILDAASMKKVVMRVYPLVEEILVRKETAARKAANDAL